MKQIKKRTSPYILSILMLVVCSFLIFSGAECSIKQDIIGKDPSSLTQEDAKKAVTGFANIMAGAAATITLIFIVWGGIQYITSAGNQEQAGKAKSTLTWAIFGFILIVSSWGILNYLINKVINK